MTKRSPIRIAYYRFLNRLYNPWLTIIENRWPITIVATILIIGFIMFCTTITPRNTIGYTSDGPTFTTPGQHIKNPFTHIDYIESGYHFASIELYTQTSDGYKLNYTIHLNEFRWDPQLFHTMYNHDESIYLNQQAKILNPILNQYMLTITGRQFYYNGESIKYHALDILTPHINLKGIEFHPTRKSDPQFMINGFFSGGDGLNELDDLYVCEQFSGLCSGLDAAQGLNPRAEAMKRQSHIASSTTANNPKYHFEPSTDPIIMHEPGETVPSSDAEVRSMMCQLYPETCDP